MGDGRTKTWTYFKDGWHEGNIGIMGPRTHAAWLCSVVFDELVRSKVSPPISSFIAHASMTLQRSSSCGRWFRTGNYSKVVPVTRIGDHSLSFGPLYTKARELYWAFAHS